MNRPSSVRSRRWYADWSEATAQTFPSDASARHNLSRTVLLLSVVIALAVLVVLLFDVINTSVGYVAVQNRIEPETLTGGRPLADLTKDELVVILQENVSAGVFRRFERDMPFESVRTEDVLTLVRERVIA